MGDTAAIEMSSTTQNESQVRTGEDSALELKQGKL